MKTRFFSVLLVLALTTAAVVIGYNNHAQAAGSNPAGTPATGMTTINLITTTIEVVKPLQVIVVSSTTATPVPTSGNMLAPANEPLVLVTVSIKNIGRISHQPVFVIRPISEPKNGIWPHFSTHFIVKGLPPNTHPVIKPGESVIVTLEISIGATSPLTVFEGLALDVIPSDPVFNQSQGKG